MEYKIITLSEEDKQSPEQNYGVYNIATGCIEARASTYPDILAAEFTLRAELEQRDWEKCTLDSLEIDRKG